MKLTLFVILVLATLVAIVNCWRRFPVYRPQNGELQVVMVLYKIIIYIYFIYILNCCDAVIYIIRWMRIMCIPPRSLCMLVCSKIRAAGSIEDDCEKPLAWVRSALVCY